MIDFVLCSRISPRAGRVLAEQIAEKQGAPCRMAYVAQQGTFIRYGNTVACQGRCLNAVSAIQLASNKLNSLMIMHYNNVSCPRVVPMEGVYDFPRIFRKRYHHDGSDRPVIVQAGGTPPRGYDYALEFLQSADEYRVHVFKDRSICVQQRRSVGDGHPLIRTTGWGLFQTEDFPDGIRALGVQAVKSLGLDFGAADIIVGEKMHVVEVNTAPGLSPRRGKRYAKAFVEWDRLS